MKFRILLNRTETRKEGSSASSVIKRVHIMADVYHGDVGDYRKEGQINDYTDLLDALFQKFNVSHPYDYLQRSLSVGDVVVFETAKGDRAFACKGAGWDSIPVQIKPRKYA